MSTKICKRCGIEKPLTDFWKSPNNRLGCSNYCKECKNWEHRSDESKEKYLLAKENKKKCYRCKKIKELDEFPLRKGAKDGHECWCFDCDREYARNFAQKEDQRRKRRERESTPGFSKNLSNYRKTSEKYRKYRNKYQSNRNKEKFKNDQNYRITSYLRNRIWASLKTQGVKKETRFNELIGCSVEFLKTHIELQFKENMTWDNYGKGFGRWSIDHIVPCAAFDLTKIEEQKKCFHYTNLQPLWVTENSSKSSYYNGINYRNKNTKK